MYGNLNVSVGGIPHETPALKTENALRLSKNDNGF